MFSNFFSKNDAILRARILENTKNTRTERVYVPVNLKNTKNTANPETLYVVKKYKGSATRNQLAQKEQVQEQTPTITSPFETLDAKPKIKSEEMEATKKFSDKKEQVEENKSQEKEKSSNSTKQEEPSSSSTKREELSSNSTKQEEPSSNSTKQEEPSSNSTKREELSSNSTKQEEPSSNSTKREELSILSGENSNKVINQSPFGANVLTDQKLKISDKDLSSKTKVKLSQNFESSKAGGNTQATKNILNHEFTIEKEDSPSKEKINSKPEDPVSELALPGEEKVSRRRKVFEFINRAIPYIFEFLRHLQPYR